MKQGQETNQIWTKEAGTDDTHNRTLTAAGSFLLLVQMMNPSPG